MSIRSNTYSLGPKSLDPRLIKVRNTLGPDSTNDPVPPPPPLDAYGEVIIADNPVGYWKMGETSGAMLDYTYLTPHNGTVTAGVRGVPGVAGNAYQVTANGDKVTIGASNILGAMGTAMSLEAWVRTTASANPAIIIAARDFTGPNGNNNYELYLTNGRPAVSFYCASGYNNLTGPSVINDGNWHHVVGTYNGSQVLLYVDAVQVASVAQAAGNINNGGGTTLNLLYYLWGAGSSSIGTFDEIAIYNTALSLARIQAHYSAGGGVLPPAQRTPVSATASSSYSGSEPPYSYDRSTATAWNAGAQPPAWIYWDFGKPFVWVRGEIQWAGKGALSYAVEGSNDTSSWTQLTTGGWPGGSDYTNIHTITDTNAYRYIRVNATQSTGDWCGIKEARFYTAGTDATPAAWHMEDALATTTNLAFSGGTWDTSSGALAILSQPHDTEYNVRHSYALNSAFDRHVVQVDMCIPNNFTSGTEFHMDVGFNTTSWGSNNTYFSARSRGTTERASWLRKSVAWTDGPIYDFTDATWYTVRMVWDVPASMFTGYINGVQVSTFSYSQSESGMVPCLAVYRYGGTHDNTKFRNLKYWGGWSSEPMP